MRFTTLYNSWKEARRNLAQISKKQVKEAVSYCKASSFSVTQHRHFFGEALRDDPNNGREGSCHDSILSQFLETHLHLAAMFNAAQNSRVF